MALQTLALTAIRHSCLRGLVAQRAPDPPKIAITSTVRSSGYTVEEMACVVERLLKDAGLVQSFSRLVVVMGHESASINNPYESADNCSFCAGESSRPNARVFAQMANDPRVRDMLAASGIDIPVDTHFLAAMHNTCNDAVEFPDAVHIPVSHHAEVRDFSQALAEACQRNSHERCRRLSSHARTRTEAGAYLHVEERAENGATIRPEYSAAGNALCVIGRRELTRGLFLDRRAFLVSYDPQTDDEEHSILSRLLSVVIPVCVNVNLNYWFSTVAPDKFGAGSKVGLNARSYLGVSDSPCSDLKCGLPIEMVDQHEPMRLLVAVEASPSALLQIMSHNRLVARFFTRHWLQLASIVDGQLFEYQNGQFVERAVEKIHVPRVETSRHWYAGSSTYLGVAEITSAKG